MSSPRSTPVRRTRRKRSTAGPIIWRRAASRISGWVCASTSTVAVTVGSIRSRTGLQRLHEVGRAPSPCPDRRARRSSARSRRAPAPPASHSGGRRSSSPRPPRPPRPAPSSAECRPRAASRPPPGRSRHRSRDRAAVPRFAVSPSTRVAPMAISATVSFDTQRSERRLDMYPHTIDNGHGERMTFLGVDGDRLRIDARPSTRAPARRCTSTTSRPRPSASSAAASATSSPAGAAVRRPRRDRHVRTGRRAPLLERRRRRALLDRRGLPGRQPRVLPLARSTPPSPPTAAAPAPSTPPTCSPATAPSSR